MKLSIQLGILSATNIGLTFIFQWYILTKLGPGGETDALFAGMTIPQIVLLILSGSLMNVLVPLFSGENEDSIRRDTWGFLTLITGLFGLLAILFYISAPWWVPVTVPGFSESGKALTVTLTRIQLVGMIFAAINGVQWAAYHARQQFLWADFTPIIASSLALLLLTWALPRFGVVGAAWVSTMRLGLQTLFLAPIMGRPVMPDMRSESIREAWRRIKPLLVGSVYYKTDHIVDRYLLSSSTSGTLSLYYLAQQIYRAIVQMLSKAIAAPVVPMLSTLHKIGDSDSFHRLYRRKLLQVCVLSAVGLLAVGLFGQTLLTILIGHGNVKASNIRELWLIMIWLGGMFIGGAAGQISSSAFYAVGDTSTPSRLGIFCYTFYVPVKIICFFYFGVAGLALSTSMFLVVNFSLQSYYFKSNHLKFVRAE